MNQPMCIAGYLMPCCCAYHTRMRIIDTDLRRYTCCQGYFDNLCCIAGHCGEASCPQLCLCLESFLCLGPSISATRMYTMDRWDLRPDGCDNRIVRFTNTLMILSCICDIMSIFVRELRHCAHGIHLMADCVFYTTIGCMISQVNAEIDYHRKYEYSHSVTVAEEVSPYVESTDATTIKHNLIKSVDL